MTYQEIAAMMKSIGLPYAYYQFPENTEQAPPVICFYFPNDENFYADDAIHTRAEKLVIELYTPEKAFDLESRIEAALDENGLAWTREEKYLPSERLIVEVYAMTVILKE